MTDKEMAEEYVRNHVHYEVAMRETGTDYAKEVSSVTIKDAFLAGLIWATPLCEACDYHVEVTDEVIAWCEIPKYTKE
jgi:hypothetical protein